ncbi:Protein CBG17457 [Caenorhabditis briggsae]|uniref:Protein CBG17457 n=1 Tax=Caenorhabditis briggsae TaxID=6238 RepID=A8XR56_CAEBR|nr:Protein CBG17457 [Caenorhabditis briggsae]CAP35129.2 Protein CBG17457 [Caenorhabditis briggsae]
MKEQEKEIAFLARQELKKCANDGKPREVVDDVRAKFSRVASVACGSYDAKRKIIDTAKGRKEDDVIEMDKGGNIANVFSQTKVQTATGSSRILVFASDVGLELLANSDTVFCDGTFDCVPAPFAQLFTLHAYVCTVLFLSCKTFSCRYLRLSFAQLFFFLLTDKQTSSYEAVLKIVLESHPSLTQWKPATVICDYETGLKNAFESQFPRASVQGCLFHLVQSWRKKAEKLQCYNEFISEPK